LGGGSMRRSCRRRGLYRGLYSADGLPTQCTSVFPKSAPPGGRVLIASRTRSCGRELLMRRNKLPDPDVAECVRGTGSSYAGELRAFCRDGRLHSVSISALFCNSWGCGGRGRQFAAEDAPTTPTVAQVLPPYLKPGGASVARWKVLHYDRKIPDPGGAESVAPRSMWRRGSSRIFQLGSDNCAGLDFSPSRELGIGT